MKKIKKINSSNRLSQKLNGINRTSSNPNVGVFASEQNQRALAFALFNSLTGHNEFMNEYGMDLDLNSLVESCSQLTLQNINNSTLTYNLPSVAAEMQNRFGHLDLEVQHIINSFIFPLCHSLLLEFLITPICELESYNSIDENVDKLPDDLQILIADRIEKPVIISEVEQLKFLTALKLSLKSIRREPNEFGIDEDVEMWLSNLNSFLIACFGTRITYKDATKQGH